MNVFSQSKDIFSSVHQTGLSGPSACTPRVDNLTSVISQCTAVKKKDISAGKYLTTIIGTYFQFSEEYFLLLLGGIILADNFNHSENWLGFPVSLKLIK